MCGDSAALGNQPEEKVQDPSRRCQRGCKTQYHCEYKNQDLHIRLDAGSPGSISFYLFLSGIEPNSKNRAEQVGGEENSFFSVS